ncbi:hypothetical protein [Streptomyces albus]|uniref:hypothetical protein n=1 Tax=Streptomyces albus TaxID=1888 RepID=UPI0033D76004
MNGTVCNARTGDCHNPVAIIRTQSGHSIALCPGCLNTWLDGADQEPRFEPTHLWWLTPRHTTE